MINKILELLQKDFKIAMIVVLLFSLYHLSLFLKTFVDKEVVEKTKCEETVELLRKQKDSSDKALIEALKLNQIKNDSTK